MESNILMENQTPVNEAPKRPQFLTVLCILSYIWSGFALICLFLCLIFNGAIFSTIENLLNGKNGMPTIDGPQRTALENLVNMGPQKFLIGISIAIIVYMTSLLGVVKMWKLQKIGFYFYAAINGLSLVYDIYSGSYFMVIISLAFIGMYFSNLKFMR
ncbi:MAG: hypothetical protein H7141_08920 [Burkholderiales bacterium]|nr:hypothetical protein [Bacteroidia bacterium]